MAGIKLRMPGGDAWQFLGTALGANPTPMAYAEVYTGLQTGAIDGQDNPLPNVENMKFYEVMSQIVLTSHLVGFDLLVDLQEGLGRHVAGAAGDVPGRRRQGDRLQHRRSTWRSEKELVENFKGKGLEDLRARCRGLPQARAGAVPRLRPGQGLAGRHGRQDQRALSRRSAAPRPAAARRRSLQASQRMLGQAS